MISPHKDDRAAWYVAGERMEHSILGAPLKHVSVYRNHSKTNDPKAHDCFIIFPADVKTRTTRFRAAETLYGISARSAVTLNCVDVERAADEFVFLFSVDYGDYQAVKFCSAATVRAWIASGRARKHEYRDRVNDASNKNDAWVIDAEWMRDA
jgi:hypothetical protein